MTVGLSKAVLRILGGPDLADAIADLTGITKKKITTFINQAQTSLAASAEFTHNDATDKYSASETLLLAAFNRAARSAKTAIPITAVQGHTTLAELITDDRTTHELASWADDE